MMYISPHNARRRTKGSTATTKRATTTSGITGAPVAYLTDPFAVTYPQPLSAEYAQNYPELRSGSRNYVSTVFDDYDIVPGDIIVLNTGDEYTVRVAEKYKHLLGFTIKLILERVSLV